MPAPHPGTWEILPYDAEVHSTHLIHLHTKHFRSVQDTVGCEMGKIIINESSRNQN